MDAIRKGTPRTLAALSLIGVGLFAIPACVSQFPPKPAPGGGGTPTTPPVTPGAVGTLPGTNCTLFPANNAWHIDISHAPVSSHSRTWMTSTGATGGTKLHPDFGPSFDPADPYYGIPYTVVSGSHPKIRIVSFEYNNESDHVAYPLGSDTKIESGGDHHALIVDKNTCRLYETYHTNIPARTASAGATWDLRSNALRPDNWTSGDLAGLPILPGLLRVDEVRAGRVDHATRVTFNVTDSRHLWPARHPMQLEPPNYSVPPMGQRFRLKANYPLTGLRSDTQTILRAFKKYGVISADNGWDWYIGGTAEPGWHQAMIEELLQVPANAFEAVDVSSHMVSPSSGQYR